MTEDEKRINNIDSRVSNLETKFEMFMRSHEEFKAEIREQNKMRIEEIRDMEAKMDAKIDKLDAKIDGIGKHVQNISVAAIAAVGGMFVAVGVMVGTMIYALLTR